MAKKRVGAFVDGEAGFQLTVEFGGLNPACHDLLRGCEGSGGKLPWFGRSPVGNHAVAYELFDDAAVVQNSLLLYFEDVSQRGDEPRGRKPFCE